MSNINTFLNKVIKVLLVCIISIMLIIGFLFITPISVHADSTYHFSVVPSSSTYSSTFWLENGIPLSSGNYTFYYAATTSNDPNRLYYTYYYDSNNTSPYRILFAAPSTSGYTLRYLYSYNNSSNTLNLTKAYKSNGTQLDFYCANAGSSTIPDDFGGNYYQTFDDALDAFSSFIQDDFPDSSGTFATFPQVSSSTSIDYVEIVTSGTFIYAGDYKSTYSFLGQYESSSAPYSQYCYVKTGEDSYVATVFSTVPLTVYKAFINGETYSYSVCSQYEEGKYVYSFNQFSTSDDIAPLVPFESLSDAKDAFNASASTGGGGSASGVASAGAISLDVPAGNVLYIKVRPGSIASVSASMPVISDTKSPYWLESQINTMWASGVAGLPSSNTVFPLSSMNRINFVPDSSKGLDGFGRSFNAFASHAPFNGGYFVVYNPAYTGSQNMYGGTAGRTDLLSINPTVTVNCQFALEYYMYPLSETLTVDGGTSSNTNGYIDSWSGSYDSSSDSFTDTSTIDSIPQIGGEQSNVVNQNNMTIGDHLHQIEQVLSDFVSNLSSLLTAPITHIQTLISYASAFMNSIAQLFTWLPQPVFNVIVSALVVAVVIGVIKLLF